MMLIVDNYDSFVHNLSRYVREEGADTHIVRNDAMSAAACLAMAPDGVILSPGPNGPAEAGFCLELISMMSPSIPLLGVCLGHQCLIEALGGRTVHARAPLHGEASEIGHDGTGVLKGIASPARVGRYHSLISVLASGSPLDVTARSLEGEVMAVRHRTRPWHGVQFHPESILTPCGRDVIRNFLALADEGEGR